MWDAWAAAVWVHENIHHFGGDPGRVVLFGQSAGANMVSHSLLTPVMEDLFQRGIAISGGSASISGSYSYDHMASIERTAQRFDCPTNDTSDMVECLRTVDAKQLMRRSTGSYGVVIDGEFVTQAREFM